MAKNEHLDFGQPLAGYRIVDLTQMIAGPSAADTLGYYGAEVIKVEPEAGDPMRFAKSPQIPNDAPSPSFMTYNRYKKSFCVNLKNPRGLQAVRDLIASSDVVIESFRPGVADRLGVGYADAKNARDDIIYASISAFGPRAGARAGVDIAVQAEAGLMSVSGTEESGPIKVGVPIIDAATAYSVDRAILAALLQRERTGRGSQIDVSMLEVALHMQAQPLAEFFFTDVQPPRLGNSAPYAAPADSFEAADGHLIISAYLEHHWRVLCELLGMVNLADDPRFHDRNARVHNRAELRKEIEQRLRTQPRAHWLELFLSRGLAVGAIRNYSDIKQDGDLFDSQTIRASEGTDGGLFQTVEVPERFNGAHLTPTGGRVVPLGNDTREILRSLGYDDAAIAELESERAVSSGKTTLPQ